MSHISSNKSKKVEGNKVSKSSRPLTLARNLSVDGVQRHEDGVRAITIPCTDPVHLSVARINAFAALVAERSLLLHDPIKGTTCTRARRDNEEEGAG